MYAKTVKESIMAERVLMKGNEAIAEAADPGGLPGGV